MRVNLKLPRLGVCPRWPAIMRESCRRSRCQRPAIRNSRWTPIWAQRPPARRRLTPSPGALRPGVSVAAPIAMVGYSLLVAPIKFPLPAAAYARQDSPALPDQHDLDQRRRNEPHQPTAVVPVRDAEQGQELHQQRKRRRGASRWRERHHLSGRPADGGRQPVRRRCSVERCLLVQGQRWRSSVRR
jgi:hypothetical protein